MTQAAARRPLGLSIADNDNEEPLVDGDGLPTEYLGPEKTAAAVVAQSVARLSEEQLAEPVSWRDLFEYGIGTSVQQSFEDGDDMRRRIRALRKEFAAGQAARFAELQLENAQLKASLAEVKAKLGEIDFVVERLRIEGRGPPGVAGPRGRDGADGARGPRGEKGERGPTGPRPVSFEVDDAAFTAVELLSDGRRGPTLRLRGMFESFNDQINDAADAEEHDAAEASRRAVEREASNVRLGLPAR
jgi:hypothetical protein